MNTLYNRKRRDHIFMKLILVQCMDIPKQFHIVHTVYVISERPLRGHKRPEPLV